jgi:hypothetical protein
VADLIVIWWLEGGKAHFSFALARSESRYVAYPKICFFPIAWAKG